MEFDSPRLNQKDGEKGFRNIKALPFLSFSQNYVLPAPSSEGACGCTVFLVMQLFLIVFSEV